MKTKVRINFEKIFPHVEILESRVYKRKKGKSIFFTLSERLTYEQLNKTLSIPQVTGYSERENRLKLYLRNN